MRKLLLLISLFAIPSAALAEIYTVCNTLDSGPGSFRQAVLNANSNAGADTINFSSTLDGLDILVESGACDITDDLFILGRGISNTILSGNFLGGIIASTTDGIDIIIRSISFEDCDDTPVFMNADSHLDIRRCQFNGNSAAGTGGGISYESTTDSALIDQCIFNGNTAAEGGAINHQGSYMRISNSTFSSNTGSASGGACKFSGDVTHLINCTFSNNSAPFGGAVKDYNLTPGSYFLNCTFSNNTASTEGGAFHTGTDFIFNTKFSMFNCIVYGNTAPEGADIWNGFGFDGTYENNIVGDCYSDVSTCPVWFSTADPLLDPSGLLDHGGFSETIEILAGSPAIDNGSSTTETAPTHDQRLRGRCTSPDIGAFESNGAEVTSSFSIVSCTNYTVPSGDETYASSGVYTDTIISSAGCDSIMTINLTITPPTTSSISITECDQYTVPSGDEVYSCSGVYSDTITNSAGCDSIITINLTILEQSSSSFTAFDCISYTVPSGDETYTTSGIYMDTISNVAGCDSIMTIDVSIGENNSAYAVVSCGHYTVPSGDETYYTSGVHTDTIPNSAGCDSVMLITMTILDESFNSFSVDQCVPYTVPSGDETYSTSGIYMDTLTAVNGCDSILTIDVTINLLDSNIVDSACGSYTVPSGDETYSMTGVYTDTITSVGGCDSVLTIDLTIKNAYTGFTVTGDTYTALASPATYQWVSCPGMNPIPGETDQSFTAPPEGGSYAVIVTENGCTDTSVCYNSNSVGIDESVLDEIVVYPNPNNGSFALNIPIELGPMEIEFLDVSGKSIWLRSGIAGPVYLVNSEVASGLYFIRFRHPTLGLKTTLLIIE